MRHAKDLEDRLYPMLRAENAEVVIHPSDRKYGALLVGGQGTGKTSALLSFYLNDIEDPDAAPIVIDPKSELSRVCLRMTPPDCGKRVWFLDLGRPAFGMSPLRLIGDRPLAIEAAQIAENVVAALLDINENQIYQSSRRYLYHAVIGAIAIATKQGRRARLEDVYTLLRPAKDEFRSAVAEACADQPDLDQTAEFFRSELPDDLRMATSRVAERLDAPRNKISGLTGVPPLRRFFNHPTDVPLREIIQARDILIVDANMGAIGTENSKACMLFILRMLHAQLQRQVHLPEAERPRVPLLVDEAHYVAGGENVVDQIATHRAAGLEPAFGLQYFAQLGSASEHQQKILKGVLNLLQSRFLFRMGDAQDAEQATRIAMAVYATMIRDDPDSRARLRVTPEQALNFPNYYCLASWIANGTRAPSFMGQTYPLPDVGDEWAEQHLAAQDERVGPYPEQLESTLATHAEPQPSDGASERAATDGRRPRRQRGRRAGTPPTGASAASSLRRIARSTRCRSTTSRRREGHRPPGEPGAPGRRSPHRRAVRAARRRAAVRHAARARVPRPHQRDRARGRTGGAGRLPRLYDEDYTILALLDRVGFAPVSLIAPGRATRPRAAHRLRPPRQALPPRADRPAHHRPARTFIQRRQTAAAALADPPRPPGRAAARARAGDLPQTRMEADRATPRRAGSRTTSTRSAGRSSSTAPSATWPPTAGAPPATPPAATPSRKSANGQRRHPITLNEIPVPDGQAIIDVELKTFTEIKPDLSLELRIEPLKLTFDLLVEIDLTARPSYNRDKFLAYDAFLCGWSLAHPRYRTQGTRPAVVFVSPNNHAALACAREADELMTGRIGVMGAPAEHWYYAGRDHLFFAIEADIHHGDLSALALPAHPPGLRERLTGNRALPLDQVNLLGSWGSSV